jgi:hypothetical protein
MGEAEQKTSSLESANSDTVKILPVSRENIGRPEHKKAS